MIHNYTVVKEEFIPMSEAKKIMKKMDKKEMSVEQRNAAEHLEKNTKLGEKESKELIQELRGLNMRKLTEFFIHQIVDILPEDEKDLSVILQKASVEFKEKDLEEIMKVVSKYAKGKK